MDDLSVKEKIVNAMAEPRAPDALVERMVQRVKAIETGRRAEEQLRSEGGEPQPEARTMLAAESIVGRLMQRTPPPDGVTGAQMARQLKEQPRFRELVESDADLLNGLTSGRLLKKLGASKETVREAGITPVIRNDKPRRQGPGI